MIRIGDVSELAGETYDDEKAMQCIEFQDDGNEVTFTADGSVFIIRSEENHGWSLIMAEEMRALGNWLIAQAARRDQIHSETLQSSYIRNAVFAALKERKKE